MQLAGKLKQFELRNEQDVEELRKLQAMEGHWGDKLAEVQGILEVAERERQRWQEQYEIVKASLDDAAKAAVAHEARKVVELMGGIESATHAFESYLDSVLAVPAVHLRQS
eukprot:SAG31_NODE_30088_length_385_cov_1.080420_1_plen_110_part_10